MTSLSIIKMSIPDNADLFFDNFEEFPCVIFTPNEKIQYNAPLRTEINTNLMKIFKKECPKKSKKKKTENLESLLSASKSCTKTSVTTINTNTDSKSRTTIPNRKTASKDPKMLGNDLFNETTEKSKTSKIQLEVNKGGGFKKDKKKRLIKRSFYKKSYTL